MDLGSRIAGWRKARGMTQRDLAEKIKLTAGAVSQFETNISAPLQETLEHIVAALGLTMHKFYGPVPNPKKAA